MNREGKTNKKTKLRLVRMKSPDVSISQGDHKIFYIVSRPFSTIKTMLLNLC